MQGCAHWLEGLIHLMLFREENICGISATRRGVAEDTSLLVYVV